MTVPEIPLSSVLPADIREAEALYAVYAGETSPGADFLSGPLRDLVTIPSATNAAHVRTIVDYVENRRSLLTLASQSDPDAAAVDEAASLYRLTRRAARPSRGDVAIVRDTDLSLALPAGTRFTAGGVAYVTTRAYVAKREPELITTAADRLISRVAAGRFQFTVPVESAVPVTSALLAGTALTIEATVAGLISVTAAGDFVAGTTAESASALLDRVMLGIAAPSPTTRDGITKLVTLAAEEADLAAPAVSVVGAGQPELRPLAVGPWPVVAAGRADVYVRPAGGPVRTDVIATATYVGYQLNNRHTWTVVLGRAVAPAYYELTSASLVAEGQEVAPPIVLAADERPAPPVGDLDYGPANGWVYSADQSGVLRFTSAVVPNGLTVGATRAIRLGLLVPPGIVAAHDALTGPNVRGPAADLIVRAAIPCLTTVSIRVDGPYSEGAVVTAVLATIERSAFSGRLTGSRIGAAVQAAIAGSVTAVGMFGRIRRPDGTAVYLAETQNELTVPHDPANGLTARTVAFYGSPTDILVTGVSS